jgi:hypothetical protein
MRTARIIVLLFACLCALGVVAWAGRYTLRGGPRYDAPWVNDPRMFDLHFGKNHYEIKTAAIFAFALLCVALFLVLQYVR